MASALSQAGKQVIQGLTRTRQLLLAAFHVRERRLGRAIKVPDGTERQLEWASTRSSGLAAASNNALFRTTSCHRRPVQQLTIMLRSQVDVAGGLHLTRSHPQIEFITVRRVECRNGCAKRAWAREFVLTRQGFAPRLRASMHSDAFWPSDISRASHFRRRFCYDVHCP